VDGFPIRDALLTHVDRPPSDAITADLSASQGTTGLDREEVLLRGAFILRSGQVATEYFDKYLFESDPALLRHVVRQMVPLIPSQTDLLGGLELGGVPLAWPPC
jgi:hypothetical protein